MNAAAVGIALVIAASSLAVAGSRRWTAALPNAPARGPLVPQLHASTDSGLDDSLAVAQEWIVSNDPFRVANAPAAVRYDPRSDGAQATTATASALLRPAFVLKAIAGGPPWRAVIDGIPGQPAGTIVEVGSVFDKLTVRAITRDNVVIKGPDTTWSLTFRSPQ